MKKSVGNISGITGSTEAISCAIDMGVYVAMSSFYVALSRAVVTMHEILCSFE